MSNNIPNIIPQGGTITVEHFPNGTHSSPSITGFTDGSFSIGHLLSFEIGMVENRDGSGIFTGSNSVSNIRGEEESGVQLTTLVGFNNNSYASVFESFDSDSPSNINLHFSIFEPQQRQNGWVVADETTQINTLSQGKHTNASIAPTSEGGFIVTWQSNVSDGSGNGINAVRYDQNLELAWESLGSVNTYRTSDQEAPSVVTLTSPNDSNQDGINDPAGFVIAYQSKGQDGSDYGIYARRYDENNKPVSSEFRVNTTTSFAQKNPVLTPLINGGFMALWESDEQDGSGWGIFGQRYDFLGNRVGEEFQVNTYTNLDQTNVAAETLNDGSVVVTWQSQGQDGSGYGIFAQMYDLFGNPIDEEFQVNSGIANDQTLPSIAKRGNDGFVIAWQGEVIPDEPKVQAQMFEWPGYAPPAFSINDVQIPENGGPAVLTVTLSEPATQTIFIKWETQEGTAAAPHDYTSDSGVLTFSPGDTTKTIEIELRDDDIDEPNEYFDVILFDSTTNNILDPLGRVTIQPKIELPDLMIDDVMVDEDAGFATLTVSLNEVASNTVTVEYMTEDDTAEEPFDYESKSGIIEFQTGETQKSIQILIPNDDEFEQDERFFVKLKNPTFAEIIDDTGIVTIKYDPDDKDNTPPYLDPEIPDIEKGNLEQIRIFLPDYFKDDETDNLEYKLVNPEDIDKSLNARISGDFLLVDFLFNQVIDFMESITIMANDTEDLSVNDTFKITLVTEDDDAYEANDQFINAYDLTNVEGTWLSDILGQGIAKNNDYYKIAVPENSQTLTVDLQFTHEQGDLDLVLYDAQNRFITSALSSTDNELITLNVPKAGDYYVWVLPREPETSNTYDLKYENVTQANTPPLIDDGDDSFNTVGSWRSATGQGFEGDVTFNDAGTGSEVATWTFTGLEGGSYQVSANWIPHNNRAKDAPFTLIGDETVTVDVNQELAPNDFNADGAAWENLGIVTITGDTITVELSDDADEYVIADAVRIEPVESPISEIIDDGDTGFSTVGSWRSATGQGFENDVTFNDAGTGSEVATWTFTGLEGGSYQVSANWTPHNNRAKDAPFTLIGDNTVTVDVNQELAPNDFNADGAAWENLGIVTITGDTITVELSDDADEYVIADAVRIEPVESPISEIIDDGDTGFSTVGSWRSATGQGFEGDVTFNDAGNGSEVATWTFTGLEGGSYQVSANWTPHNNRAKDAPFTLIGDNTVTVDVNQELAPNDFNADGAAWENLGIVTITGDTITVELSDDADEYVIADAVRIEPVETPPVVPSIIDDGDDSFKTVGGWRSATGQGFENDVTFNDARTGSEVATWTFDDLISGKYKVYATWTQHANRASDAPFTVKNGQGDTLLGVDVNQKVAPDDLIDGGVAWEALGDVEVTGDSLLVELSDNANGYVIADAIRIEKVELGTTSTSLVFPNPDQFDTLSLSSVDTSAVI